MEKPTKTAKQLLDLKHHVGFISVPADGTVLDALRVLADKNIGAVLVMQGDRLAGIFSERDYARKGEIAGRTAAATLVRDMMTSTVISISSDRSVEECRKIMGDARIRHLPIVDSGKVVGVLSSKDILDEVIAEDEKLIKKLETDQDMAAKGLY